jgi:hypothetical protein
VAMHKWPEEEAGVEEAACSGAGDEAMVCSGAGDEVVACFNVGIKDRRWRWWHNSFRATEERERARDKKLLSLARESARLEILVDGT